jgi:Flp pilus assembly pilin Flp
VGFSQPGIVTPFHNSVVFHLQGAISMGKIVATAKKFLIREEGPTMAEYGLMVAVVALVAVVGAAALGNDLSSFFTAVGTKISSYAP